MKCAGSGGCGVAGQAAHALALRAGLPEDPDKLEGVREAVRHATWTGLAVRGFGLSGGIGMVAMYEAMTGGDGPDFGRDTRNNAVGAACALRKRLDLMGGCIIAATLTAKFDYVDGRGRVRRLIK